VEIIAELAQGYEGNVEKASLLLNLAANVNADCAKFQVIYADEICTPSYQYYDLFKSLEMPRKHWQRLVAEAESSSIEIILDVFGKKSALLADVLGVRRVMLHATDVNNSQLIDFISNLNFEHVYVGVGGARMNEIERLVDRLCANRLVLMTGFQAYPTEVSELNLQKVKLLHDKFQHTHPNVEIGYGDHCLPDSTIFEHLCCCAASFGATVLEKHLTLAPELKMEDYEAAIGGNSFVKFVENIRLVTGAYDLKCDDFDLMSDGELKYKSFVRRHPVAVTDLKLGEILSEKNVQLKRTGSEGEPIDIEGLFGKSVNKDCATHEMITLEKLN
jgi:N,N'-diacetyllegionaminate synthase